MTGYCIVDVCGTLVVEDTTIGLLRRHFARTSRWRQGLLVLATARWSPFRLLAAALERLLHRPLLKYLLVALLDGQEYAALQESAREYARWLLADRRVEPVSRVLREHASDRMLVLASSSLEPVVSALAQQLSARYVASSLEISGTRMTGRYQEDITGHKTEALCRSFAEDWRQTGYFAISDNPTDRKLLAHAAEAWVVLRHARHRKRWAGISANFIDLDP